MGRAVRDDYAYDPDPFCPDEPRVRAVKWICENRLSAGDCQLIRLYAECGTVRRLGEKLGVSKSTAAKEMRRIRDIILTEYGKLDGHCFD